MSESKRRLVERIRDPEFIEDIESKSIEDLRQMREDAREGENELSFERRLCQARIDILSAELDRRSGDSGGGLLERLPEILATEAIAESDSPLPSRAPDYTIPRNADVPRRRVEEIVGEQTLARLPQLSPEEIRGIMQSLADHEREVSGKRKQVQEIMDKVQAEIVRRYTSGEADPAAALR